MSYLFSSRAVVTRSHHFGSRWRYWRVAFVFIFAAAITISDGIYAQNPPTVDAPTPRLIYPNGLAIENDQSLLISDIGTHSIYRCDPSGRLTLVAGTGQPGFSGDGGAATSAKLNSPFDVAIDGSKGAILVADTYNHRVRRINRAGRISTIAGNGESAYAGDGGSAVEAALQLPQGIAVDRAGNLYIADTFNHVVRRVDASGTITTVAGSEPGLAGDGGPALKAQLNLPQAVAVDESGCLYVSDAGNSRIRRVNRDGVIETIVGFGEGALIAGSGYEGDGGPPEKAKIFSAADFALGPWGNLYVADTGNNRIRHVLYGAIHTVAGTGAAGFAGDGGRAIDAALKAPQKIAVAADGTIYIADRANHRVRVVSPAGKIRTLVGNGEPDAAIHVANN